MIICYEKTQGSVFKHLKNIFKYDSLTVSSMSKTFTSGGKL